MAFQAFDADLRPGPDDVAPVRALRDEVALRLEADPSVLRVVEGGSWLNGTAVRDRSRLDLFVVVGSRARPPARLAGSLVPLLPADLLLDPQTDGSLVLERLGTPGLRLIPALESEHPDDAGVTAGSGELRVPDASGRWVRHRPVARSVLLSRLDGDGDGDGDAHAGGGAGGGGVRGLIRLLLAWKHRQAVPISSYYLETLALRQALQQHSFSVLWDACWVWERLRLDGLTRVPDPTSPDGRQGVRATATLAGAVAAQYPVERAATSSRAAVNAYLDGDLETSGAYLRMVFGSDFPGF
ncbi:hypothetical protein N1028_11195 [Herbiconiux sp. CPCC 203407]|uniref:Nucleotidyltransferase domain-containing protein n=1 Tax=Herbiconiux oxytropis TaxID=2970915 RepID=A0AA42BWK9_9MICO|nr:hypothetical protein [Herbiconiux oxytropis]MCS5722518.1 hypothetical protein [Herbiconiux oxytropis]MCS5726458.1 hypothetical protein [Herbiconiux oxytropis]